MIKIKQIMQEELVTGQLLATDSCWNHQKCDAFQKHTRNFSLPSQNLEMAMFARLRLLRQQRFRHLYQFRVLADGFITFIDSSSEILPLFLKK